MSFISMLLGGALKDNYYVFKAVVSGILRVSQGSLFSGLNNFDVFSTLEEDYSSYFGFTETEVAALLEATGHAARQPQLEAQIKDWYNGYRFGHDTIYNPWSIISCLSKKGRLKPYWINTSAHVLLKTLMAKADAEFKEGLEQLLSGEAVSAIVDPNLVFNELDGDSTTLWSLLLFSGYLTTEEVTYADDGSVQCELRIPYREIAGLYSRSIQQWFSDSMGLHGYRKFLRSLVSGNITEFESWLRAYLLESMSLFDAQGHHPEKFYHGLVLGLMVGLRDTRVIYSNRESGHGRYDVALLPKEANASQDNSLGIVMEFKQAENAAMLQAAAESALAQINTRYYEAELRQHQVNKILGVELAFSGKNMALTHKITATA